MLWNRKEGCCCFFLPPPTVSAVNVPANPSYKSFLPFWFPQIGVCGCLCSFLLFFFKHIDLVFRADSCQSCPKLTPYALNIAWHSMVKQEYVICCEALLNWFFFKEQKQQLACIPVHLTCTFIGDRYSISDHFQTISYIKFSVDLEFIWAWCVHGCILVPVPLRLTTRFWLYFVPLWACLFFFSQKDHLIMNCPKG